MDREVISKSEVTVKEERNNGGGISRRTFLKGAGSIAAAAAVLGVSGLKSKALAQGLPAFVSLPKAKMLEMYRRMQCISQGEWKIYDLCQTPKDGRYPVIMGNPWTGHPSIGEEATCVGVAIAMAKDDYLVGSHRSHGYPLAMGMDLNSWMAELFGKVTGSNRGHGGSMHIADPSIGLLGMSGIVGASVPHAVGAAKAAEIRGTKQVAISTCGDAAMQSSGFSASLNLAAIWNVPVVFVINNNQWGMMIPSRWHDANVKSGKDISVRAAGFAIPGIVVDGNDVFAVYKAAKYCIDRAREGKGPSLLECVTFRQRSHGSSQAPHEVTQWPHNRPEELAYWLARDPNKRFERTVVQGGLLTEAELKSVRKDVAAEIEAAVDFAAESPSPKPEEEFKYFREVFGARV